MRIWLQTPQCACTVLPLEGSSNHGEAWVTGFWEMILYGFLVHTLWSKAFSSFYSGLFKDICIMNNFRRQRWCLLSGQRAGTLSNIMKIIFSLWSKGPACLQPIIKDLGLLSTGVFACIVPHWVCSCYLKLFMLPCGSLGQGNHHPKCWHSGYRCE